MKVVFFESVDFLLEVLVVLLLGLDYQPIICPEFVYVVSDYVLDSGILVVYQSPSDLVFDQNGVLGLH